MKYYIIHQPMNERYLIMDNATLGYYFIVKWVKLDLFPQHAIVITRGGNILPRVKYSADEVKFPYGIAFYHSNNEINIFGYLNEDPLDLTLYNSNGMVISHEYRIIAVK